MILKQQLAEEFRSIADRADDPLDEYDRRELRAAAAILDLDNGRGWLNADENVQQWISGLKSIHGL